MTLLASRLVSLPALLSPKQIAKRWGCKVDVVLAAIHSGKLRALNLGAGRCKGRYKIDPRDLEAFERGREVQPPLSRGRKRRSASPSYPMVYPEQ